jgi:uncharacterized membrane protein YhiD involved in acid resistance
MDLTWSLVFRIALAALLGAILGIQRSRAGQSAGIRTNMMIAIASRTRPGWRLKLSAGLAF